MEATLSKNNYFELYIFHFHTSNLLQNEKQLNIFLLHELNYKTPESTGLVSKNIIIAIFVFLFEDFNG